MLCSIPSRRKTQGVRTSCICQALFFVGATILNVTSNSLQCREERIENSGPLGKEQVANKEIEAVEAELRAARQQGTADAFALYLYGLVLIDK